jgi:hypothetical protein
MQSIYRINSKSIPSIWDEGTEYLPLPTCKKCGAVPSKIEVLGAYLPTFGKSFGLALALGGLVASEECIKYLLENGIDCFELGKVNVRFGKYKGTNEKFHWLKPLNEVEINNGTGAVICDKCGLGRWAEGDWEVRKIKGVLPADIVQIKHTWVLLASERFMKIAKDIPGKCYLNFEEWASRS